MDILANIQQIIITIVTSSLFIIVAWVGWQFYSFRRHRKESEAILSKLSAIEKRLEKTAVFQVTLDHHYDVEGHGASVSVSAPTINDCESLLAKHSPKIMPKIQADDPSRIKEYSG